MPPRFRYTRQEMIRAALDITRAQGPSGLTARALAQKLDCSVKPIFGLFRNMEEVQQAVLSAAHDLYRNYLRREMTREDIPPYKACGMGYIRFAKEEKNLFRLLFMRDRTGEEIPDDREEIEPYLRLIEDRLGVGPQEARQFHLEMWLYVHGVAAMVATSYLEWDTDFISRALTDAFEGLCMRFTSQKQHEAPQSLKKGE